MYVTSLSLLCNHNLLFIFRCVINCKVKISPSVKLAVQSQCQGSQCYKISSYEWILYEHLSLVLQRKDDLHLITDTPLGSNSIVIKGGSLAGGKQYRLVLFVTTTDGLSGMSAYDFSTMLPPTGGTCSIIPSSGFSLKTEFNLTCSNWKSDSTPLSYQFQYKLENGLYSMLYNGLSSTFIFWLPPGNTPENYTLKVVVTVTDAFGASAPAVNLSVQVGC